MKRIHLEAWGFFVQLRDFALVRSIGGAISVLSDRHEFTLVPGDAGTCGGMPISNPDVFYIDFYFTARDGILFDVAFSSNEAHSGGIPYSSFVSRHTRT